MLFALATVLGLAAPALADQVVDGSTGPGSVYRLVRPSNWNGILLLYAHGYVSKDVPVGITPDDQLVISLLATQGFAVAVSSFSENGWVLKDGTQRTHQLLGLFTSKFGKPARVYAAGASMGGLIATASSRPGRASSRECFPRARLPAASLARWTSCERVSST